MDIYDTELHQKIIAQMRAREIEDFSEEEIERVFSDFDVPERLYLDTIEWLIDTGLTIDDVRPRGIER